MIFVFSKETENLFIVNKFKFISKSFSFEYILNSSIYAVNAAPEFSVEESITFKSID